MQEVVCWINYFFFVSFWSKYPRDEITDNTQGWAGIFVTRLLLIVTTKGDARGRHTNIYDILSIFFFFRLQ